MKQISVILIFVLLYGCNLIDSDAVKFAKSAVKGDLEYVWKHASDEAKDGTLTDSEKRDAFKEFSENYPKSLPYGLRDLNDIIKYSPTINEIGSKKKDGKTIYALTATYKGKQGYSYGEGEIAKAVKFTIEINNETGLVIDVDFDKVLERNENATLANRRSEAKKLYAEYKKDKSSVNKINVRKILKMYQSDPTLIKELDNELEKVAKLIKAKSYSGLVKIKDSGGHSSKGKKISMGEGYGIKLENYIKLENLTNIPLVVTFSFDLEIYSSWKEYCSFLSASKCVKSRWDVYEKNQIGKLKIYSKETDYASKYYNDIRYYQGYRVTQQRSDGTYSYSWDDKYAFRANNLKIKSIAIWNER